MERVRRRKLCGNVKYLKRFILCCKMKKAEYDIPDEVDNNVRCSGQDELCHPYDDDIHWIHALGDVTSTANISINKIYWLFDAVPYDSYTGHSAFRIVEKVSFFHTGIFHRMLEEAHYADKRKDFYQEEVEYAHLVKQFKVYQNREVPVCGNYIKFADVLVEKAKQSIADSRDCQERKKHIKKLKFFQAMNSMKSIFYNTV